MLAICIVTYRGVVAVEHVTTAANHEQTSQVMVKADEANEKLEQAEQRIKQMEIEHAALVEKLGIEYWRLMKETDKIINDQTIALAEARTVRAPPPPIVTKPVSVSNSKYNEEQIRLLTLAHEIGLTVGFPETVQAILIQETLAGAYGDRIGDTNLPLGKRSYGVMQMKVATARGILKKYPTLVGTYFPKRKVLKKVRDEEIIIKLIQNDIFAIKLAALNVAYHRERSKSWAVAVVAYNTGQGRANKIKNHREHIYFKHIVRRITNEVRPFNKKFGLSET